MFLNREELRNWRSEMEAYNEDINKLFLEEDEKEVLRELFEKLHRKTSKRLYIEVIQDIVNFINDETHYFENPIIKFSLSEKFEGFGGYNFIYTQTLKKFEKTLY
jgi:hypothetical protein